MHYVVKCSILRIHVHLLRKLKKSVFEQMMECDEEMDQKMELKDHTSGWSMLEDNQSLLALIKTKIA